MGFAPVINGLSLLCAGHAVFLHNPDAGGILPESAGDHRLKAQAEQMLSE